MDLFGNNGIGTNAKVKLKNLDLPDAQVCLYENFFSEEESEFLFKQLATTINWEQKQIKLFGKLIAQPRLTAFYGDAHKNYTYSGLLWEAKAWTEELLMIKLRIEEVCKESFTSVLMNYYRYGEDSMGWHADDEKELGSNPIIASISFGETRSFQMRHRHNKEIEKLSIQLTKGSLLLMTGSTQHFWQHQIPKSSKCLNPRINLTFRQIKN